MSYREDTPYRSWRVTIQVASRRARALGSALSAALAALAPLVRRPASARLRFVARCLARTSGCIAGRVPSSALALRVFEMASRTVGGCTRPCWASDRLRFASGSDADTAFAQAGLQNRSAHTLMGFPQFSHGEHTFARSLPLRLRSALEPCSRRHKARTTSSPKGNASVTCSAVRSEPNRSKASCWNLRTASLCAGSLHLRRCHHTFLNARWHTGQATVSLLLSPTFPPDPESRPRTGGPSSSYQNWRSLSWRSGPSASGSRRT